MLWVVGAKDKLAQLGLISSSGQHTLNMSGDGLKAWQIIHNNRKEWIDSSIVVNCIRYLVANDILGDQESKPTEEQLKNCTNIAQLLLFYFDEPEEVAKRALIATSKKR